MRDILAHLNTLRAKTLSRGARVGLLRGGLPPETWWAEPKVRTVLIALLVASAYYIGALIGLSATFQSSIISPNWPPNTILLVALLSVPTQKWRACLLAVFAAHMLALLPDGISLLTASGLYLTNTGEAVLGAYLVRRLIGGPPWLGSPRRVGLYLACAVVVAPFVTSFADAAVVTLTGSRDHYWLNFRTRCVSNILAELTIGPALLLGLGGAWKWLRDAGRWRRVEAALLAVGLLLVGIMVFGSEVTAEQEELALLSTLLPLLLWATVRFGIGGASASLLGITILSTWGTVQGRGPFSASSPDYNVVSFQLFLIGMSVPVLFLAALLQEREETKATLQASEQRYRAMVETQTELISRYLPDSTLTFINDAHCRLIGKTREELIGAKFLDMLPESARVRVRAAIQSLLVQPGILTIEHEAALPDGSLRWQQWVNRTILDANGHVIEFQGIGRDITERKQAEAALQASEGRYRDLVESQVDMICRYLPDSTLTFVNDAYCRYYGKSREQLIGSKFVDFLDEAARTHHRRYTEALLAEPHPTVDEHEAVRPDGTIGWQQWIDHAIRDAEGHLVEFQAIGRDITERKRAEEALRESEARFRAAFESAATGMMLVDTEGHALQVNRPLVEMLGYTEEEFHSQAFAEFTYPDDVGPNLLLFHRALTGEIDSYQLEKRFITKRGDLVWGHLSAGVVRDAEGRPLYIVGQVQDITERKRAEEAVRESEERYRALVNNFPQGAVLLFGLDLRHLVADGQGLAELGLSKGSVEGKTISEAFPADLAAMLTPRYQAALAGEHAAFDLPHAGHIYQVQVLPIQYAGTTAGMAVMQDVTEQRRAQALAELDRAKTAFIANVSHEFRTPLTLLLGPAADALADREAPLPARQRERLEFIERSGLRLYKLVNTLLDFSSIEAGRLQATFVPTDLAAFTAELASTFRSAIERAELRLRVDCPPLISLRQPVYVDRDMWERIVLNLLSNALKFTFAGEIVVSLRPVPAERAERVELEVRDTGVGIPAEALPHLFERFYRVPGLRGRTHEGTGIGLALVQELVQLHGGTVRASSAGGVGSSFTVGLFTGTAHLPAIYAGNQVHAATEASAAPSALAAKPFVEEALGWLPDPADAYQPAGGTAAGALTPLQSASHDVLAGASDGLNGHGREARLRRDDATRHDAPWASTQGRTEYAHILVADDNADMRAYLTHILGERWEVEAVADGAAALAAALARPPDLIVADVMMPGLDGVALLRALRADPATRVIPVLMLSARAGEEATVEGLDAGADDYLTKPFAARELLARVRTHLALASARGEVARAAERNRIARELHDNVTQDIYSTSLLAQAIPRLWEQHRAEAERCLHNLDQLTRSALAGLRALLLEMRPAVLEQKALADLLRQLGDAMMSRTEVPIAVLVTGEEPPIPTEVKFVLYRIAQEALTNATKHAAASHITVRLAGRRGGELIQLDIRDDGRGFAPGAVPVGHFGLGMMRERAREIGAILRIRSRSGHGTRVVVVWRAGTNREGDPAGGGGAERTEEAFDGRARR